MELFTNEHGIDIFMFNTGVKYTEHGQRIYVAMDNVRFVFWDADRMVDGVISSCASSDARTLYKVGPDAMERWVLNRYKTMAYKQANSERELELVQMLRRVAREDNQ